MIRSALKNPYLIIVMALATLVLGVTSYQKIPADLLPIYETPAVQIVTFYPGMPPEVMERDIMSRLQRWTGQSVGIEHQEAKAMLGVCVVKDFFREDISLDTAMAQVTSYAVSDMFYLPPGTIPPMMMPFDPTASVPLCLISVSSNRDASTPEKKKKLAKELYDVAYYELRNQLQSISGVIAPAVYGGTLRRILVYLDRQKLEARKLDLVDVQQQVLKHNVFIPAGNAKMGNLDYQIHTNAMPDLVERMNDIPIAYENGRPIRVRDVGEARDSSQIQSNIVRINGRRPAMYIPIYRQPGANSIEIVDRINARLDQILQRLKTMEPEKADGLQLNVVMDQSEGVRENLEGLQIAGGLGALLAGIVVLLFLGNWRLTTIIVLAIPLSILAAFIGLFYTGDTINAMTLGGLALAIGILIDQAIVVLDNIVRHRNMGKTRMEAAVDGTKEVALPLAVSILTFIVVFFPVVFLSGLARYLFTPLALAVTFSVVASYLVAIFFVPVCAVRFLGKRREGEDTRPDHEKPGLLGSIIRGYGLLLRATMKMRWLTILISIGLFVFAIPLLMNSGTELFPQTDSGQFTILCRLPSGTRIEITENTMAAIEKEVETVIGKPDPGYSRGEEKYPDSNLQLHISNMGVLMDWPAAYTPNTGAMDGFMLVQLKGKSDLPGTFDYVTELRKRLNKKFPGVEFAFDTGGMMTAAMNLGEPSPIHLQITGSKLHTAQEIAKIVRKELQQVEGATDVRIFQRMDYPTLEVEIDRMKAADQKVTTEGTMKNLVSAFNSSVNFLPAFWIDPRNGNHYFIGVQYREEDIKDFETLKNIPISSGANTMMEDDTRHITKLRNVATVKQGTGPAVITHRNITRTTDIYANVLPGYDVGSIVTAIEARLSENSDLDLEFAKSARGDEYKIQGKYADQGYSLQFQGEVRRMREAFWQFAGGLGIAAVLVFLVMVALFRSFLTPIVVMVTVPLGFIGVAAILWLTGTHLNIQSFMGIIMMMGIVVEYSIVLLDFADHRVREGATPSEAVYEAALVRFRPILMTSVTTILALLPMAFGFAGSEADRPLALTIVGGVIAATLLPKFVIPCLYSIMKRPEPATDPYADD